MGLVRLCLLAVVAAVAAGCATSGAVPKPFPGAPGAAGGAAGVGAPAGTETSGAAAGGRDEGEIAARRGAVVETALSFRGVPYRNGGSDPSGFDCSGLVQYAFARHGFALPREVSQQYRLGAEIRLAGIQPGDLVFFAIDGNGPSHVGVAVGTDEFVHAPSRRGVVRVERFSSPYWARRILGVRRIAN